MDLDPAWRLFDALTWVVGPPAFHEAHPQDAQPAQVIHPDAGSSRQTCGEITASDFNIDATLRAKLCRDFSPAAEMLLNLIKVRNKPTENIQCVNVGPYRFIYNSDSHCLACKCRNSVLTTHNNFLLRH